MIAVVSQYRIPPSQSVGLRMRGAGMRRVAVFPGTLSYGFLLLFVIVLYANPGLLIHQLAALAPAQLVGGFALAAMAFEKLKNREGIWLVWPHSYLLIALVWTAGLSCFTAVWPRLSVDTTIDLAKYFIIYLVLVNSVNNEKRLKGVLWTMVLGGLFPSLGTLHNYAIGKVDPGSTVHWVGVFANSNDLAYSMVLLVPLALALCDGLTNRQRPFLWGLIVVYIATIYLTFSRGGLIGLLAVLVIMGVRHRSGSVRLATFGAVAACLIFMTFFWTRAEGFTNLADYTLHQRLIQVKAGFEMFLDRPFLGVGLGGSVAAFPLYSPPNLDFTSSFVVHNTFVLALSELGFFGCLFFVMFIATGIVDACRMVRAAKAEECSVTDFLAENRNDESPAAFRPVNAQAMRPPASAALVDGIATSLCGYVVCGLFGPYLMSWFPFILVGLVSAALKIRQQGAAVASTEGSI
jgi:O-antigen ligase